MRAASKHRIHAVLLAVAIPLATAAALLACAPTAAHAAHIAPPPSAQAAAETAPERAASKPSAKKVRSLYRAVLARSGGNCYAVYDIDANGVPELMVNKGAYEADYRWVVYTVRSGKAKRVGEFSGTHVGALYCKPGKGFLCSWQAAQGYSTLYRITVRKGKVASRRVVKEGPYADLAGMPKTNSYKTKHKLKALKWSSVGSYALLNRKVK